MSLIFQSARARVVYQPVGVVGILAPWNFPVLLSLGPLVSALAAGNRVMLKLSEFTPATNTVLRDVIGACFSEDHVAIVTGEVDVSIAFSRKPFDHLVFTGSEQTAHHVMRAAARNLTPVTLELGGKTPALIDPAADLREAVARIAFGKALNAGQSRAAPDYILCPRERVEEFVELFQERFARLYPSLCDNPDYSNIINRHHYRRLQRMLADARELGARLIEVNSDGCSFEGSRILPVYLILNVTDDMRVMQEELFGPLLPIVGYDEFDSALRYINSRPRALALYYFGRDRDRRQRVLEETTSGGVCINDTQVHAAVETIPFGGVGASGLGRYTSREGFETFSNVKAVFERLRPNGAALLYPPYGGLLQRLVRRILLR